MTQEILIAVSPFVVAVVAQAVKWFVNKVTTLQATNNPLHTGVIRFAVAALAFGSVVGSAILSGQDVDTSSIETFSSALLVFVASTGVFFLSKRKSQ